jgi:hypothetical protein
MLRLVALVSGLYDTVVGALLLLAAPRLAALFGSRPVEPAVFGDTNGLFLICIGLGYWLPLRDPQRWRAYLWLMGPALKFGGAALFLRDYWLRGSPATFLLFAMTDGALAAWTLWALLRAPRAERPIAV